jgi:hypothetical protein
MNSDSSRWYVYSYEPSDKTKRRRNKTSTSSVDATPTTMDNGSTKPKISKTNCMKRTKLSDAQQLRHVPYYRPTTSNNTGNISGTGLPIISAEPLPPSVATQVHKLKWVPSQLKETTEQHKMDDRSSFHLENTNVTSSQQELERRKRNLDRISIKNLLN